VLTIYNTLTKSKEVFKPLDGNNVRMYVCGMTVYDYCHIGHGRSMVAFDLVTRWLRFSGYNLTYVRNITDIEDKIINRARENGEPYDALTERMITAMHEDEARLNIKKPDMEPRATDHIPGMLSMIQTLIDKGYAYAPGNGDVYYRVAKFMGYGKLSRKKIEDLRIGARIEVDEAKQDPLDFVLWKATKPGENNFFTIRDVLEKYHPEVVRYLLVSSHYRSAINYSEDNLKDAKGALERFYHALKGLPSVAPAGGEAFVERFTAVMNDDFGTPEACAVLFEMVREINRLRESDLDAAAGLAARLKELASVLGVLQLEADDFLQAGAEGRVDAAEVDALIAARLAARAGKDWAESDRIRDQLTAMGVVLEDGKGGTTWRLAD
jgi:cysteinyl-tRNA synthetase